MGTRAARYAVTAVVVLALVAVPAGLAAKERRGAMVVVTLTGGRLFEGELIAARPDSLVLLSPDGRDVFVAAAEIGSVRIVRPSKIEKGALWGGLGGALIGGALGGLSGGLDEYTAGQAAFLLGVVFGGAGCLAGLGVGTLMSVDTTIPFAGEPEPLVRSRLEQLRIYSREYRLGGGRLQLKIGLPAAPAPSRRSPRFRAHLPYTLTISARQHWSYSDTMPTTFRFLDALPDPGPHPAEPIHHAWNRNGAGLDSFSLDYEVSERLAIGAEFVLAKWSAATDYEIGPLQYTSTVDGKTYGIDGGYVSFEARFSAALVGLTYRPFAPTEFRRHIIEAGLAAGPAWTKFNAESWFLQTERPGGKMGLSARAHVAYDFYVIPSLSFGAAVGYRHFRTRLPDAAAAATLNFWQSPPADPPVSIERTTVLTIPSRPAEASGFYISFRTGLRF